jgi:hypothetical protein
MKKWTALINLIHASIFFAIVPMSGCSEKLNDRNRVKEFAQMTEKAARNFAIGSLSEFIIPPLTEKEVLLVITGAYMGYVNPMPFLDERVARMINLKYGSNESGRTYILLIRDQRIVAEDSVDMWNFIVSDEVTVSGSCARIADWSDKKAIVRCLKRDDSMKKNMQNYDYWNNECVCELVNFE